MVKQFFESTFSDAKEQERVTSGWFNVILTDAKNCQNIKMSVPIGQGKTK